jgi:hypothetical protein
VIPSAKEFLFLLLLPIVATQNKRRRRKINSLAPSASLYRCLHVGDVRRRRRKRNYRVRSAPLHPYP